MGPSVETLSPEIANFRPPLSTRVSLFHLVLSVLEGANSFQLSVLFVIFTSVLCNYRILSCQIWIGVATVGFIVRIISGTGDVLYVKYCSNV